MLITLKDSFVTEFAAEVKAQNLYPILAAQLLERVSRYGEGTVTVDTSKLEEYEDTLTPTLLEDLIYGFAQKTKNQGVMMFIGSIRTALKDVNKSKPGSLPALQAALIEYFKRDAIDGWLYKRNYDGKFLAYAVNKVHLHLASKREKEEGHKDSVTLSFTANSTQVTSNHYSRNSRRDDGSKYDNVQWEWGDFNKKTLPELLAEKNIFHETAELKVDYLRQLALYQEYRPMFAQQFTSAAGAYEADATDNERNSGRSLANLSFYINDDLGTKRAEMAQERDNSWWVNEQGASSDLFLRLPVHPYLKMFNLGTHEFVFMHVDSVRPYVFDPSLRDKIVLPDAHRDLIDVLVSDLEAIAGDVVAGKGGGTSILCQGKSGLGKTLTAEIYSEVSQKPLYRVHSGQLGIGPKEVEGNLKMIFERAQRWKCILLLDEADVYIRRRGDDLEHNAVVACFLRTMEYFSGIFFMTTNREDDVDDAIVSRCIAVITYKTPGAEELGRIFRIQADRLGAGLSEDEIDKLTHFYGGKISGRDAKQLLELATRYADKRGERVSSETVRKLAQFKGF